MTYVLPVPDLRFRLESRLLRTLMGLPPGLQRRLVRRPLELRGEQLAPELQLMFGLQRLARLPDAASLPLDAARAEIDRQSRLTGGRQTVGAFRDLVVDGAEGPLRARLYIPTERTGADPAPTMLFLHGGGFMYGGIESHDAACRVLAERSGVQLLSVDYRLAPEHPFPAAPEDAVAAYRWLVGHTGAVNADPARLAVGGDSAGGNLSAVVALRAAEEGLPLAFQLLIYPGTTFAEISESRREYAPHDLVLTQAFLDGAKAAYVPDEQHWTHPDVSVLARTSLPAGLAPAHVVTAGFDPLRDEGEDYADLLRAAGVHVTAKQYPGLVHAFLNIVGVGRECRAAVDDIANTLRAALA